MLRLLLCIVLAMLLAFGAGNGSLPAATAVSLAAGATAAAPCPSAAPDGGGAYAAPVGIAATALQTSCPDCPAMPAGDDSGHSGKSCNGCTAPPPGLVAQGQPAAPPTRTRRRPGRTASRGGEDLSPDPHPPRHRFLS